MQATLLSLNENRALTRVAATVTLSLFLSACGGGGGSLPAFCPPAPVLTFGTLQDVTDYLKVLSSPFPPSGRYQIDFDLVKHTFVPTTPFISGSDGSTVVIQNFQPELTLGLTGGETLDDYIGFISGLHPSTTYTVTLPPTTVYPEQGTTPCSYGTQLLGTFATAAQ